MIEIPKTMTNEESKLYATIVVSEREMALAFANSVDTKIICMLNNNQIIEY